MQFEKLLFLIHFQRMGKDKKESEALCVKEFYTNKQKHAMKKEIFAPLLSGLWKCFREKIK